MIEERKDEMKVQKCLARCGGVKQAKIEGDLSGWLMVKVPQPFDFPWATYKSTSSFQNGWLSQFCCVGHPTTVGLRGGWGVEGLIQPIRVVMASKCKNRPGHHAATRAKHQWNSSLWTTMKHPED